MNRDRCTIEVGDVVFDGRVSLRNGCVVVTAEAQGPVPEVHGRISLRGADGLLVLVGGPLINVKATENTLRFIYSMTIDSVDNGRIDIPKELQ